VALETLGDCFLGGVWGFIAGFGLGLDVALYDAAGTSGGIRVREDFTTEDTESRTEITEKSEQMRRTEMSVCLG